MGLFTMKPKKPEAHLQLLGTLFLILQQVRREGLMSIEGPVERPQESPLFSAIAPFDQSNATVYTLLCDALRLLLGGLQNSAEMARYLAAARKTSGLSSKQQSLFDTLEITLLAAMDGNAPRVAVEFGRQCTPARLKPSFAEFEDFLKGINTRKNSMLTRAETDAALVRFFDGMTEPAGESGLTAQEVDDLLAGVSEPAAGKGPI